MSPDSDPRNEPAGRQGPVRSPNFMRFLITGAVLGLIAGMLLGLREPGGPSYTATSSYDAGSAMGYLGAFGAMLGAGLAALLALVLERTGRR